MVVRVDVRLALHVTEGERAQRGHLGDQPSDLQLATIRVLDIPRVGIERRQRAHRRHQHAHRMCVVAETLDELLEVLVQERVVCDLVDPAVELILRGELAVQQQV